MSNNGTIDKIKGTVKEGAGNVTDNKKMKAEGILEKTVGKVKEATESVAEDVKGKFNK